MGCLPSSLSAPHCQEPWVPAASPEPSTTCSVLCPWGDQICSREMLLSVRFSLSSGLTGDSLAPELAIHPGPHPTGCDNPSPCRLPSENMADLTLVYKVAATAQHPPA